MASSVQSAGGQGIDPPFAHAPSGAGNSVAAGFAASAAQARRHRLNLYLAFGATGAVVALLVGAGIVLWMRHGVAIFFDTVAAGIATCF